MNAAAEVEETFSVAKFVGTSFGISRPDVEAIANGTCQFVKRVDLPGNDFVTDPPPPRCEINGEQVQHRKLCDETFGSGHGQFASSLRKEHSLGFTGGGGIGDVANHERLAPALFRLALRGYRIGRFSRLGNRD